MCGVASALTSRRMLFNMAAICVTRLGLARGSRPGSMSAAKRICPAVDLTRCLLHRPFDVADAAFVYQQHCIRVAVDAPPSMIVSSVHAALTVVIAPAPSFRLYVVHPLKRHRQVPFTTRYESRAAGVRDDTLLTHSKGKCMKHKRMPVVYHDCLSGPGGSGRRRVRDW